jgi:V8-like Glu-specific endopeptidase
MKILRSPRILLAAVLVLQVLSVRPVLAQASPTSVASLRQQDPYRHVGLLSFFSGREEYIGSATVIKPRSLLTAGHNLYSTGTGWSAQVVFERSYYNGSRASRSTASGLFVLGGYASLVDRGRSETNQGFSRDLGGVVCFSQPQGGLHAAWQQNTRLLTGRSYNMSLGYGAVVHSGEELLRSSPTKAFYQVTGSFYENRSYGIEGGMSGGPVFAKSGGKWYVCAVNVSGPAGRVFNKGAGVRAIDKDAAALIETDLK